ncbi:MAG: sigma-70 family RNA polymerase sigma factor [Mogibacterium sp.]|nr:sigma-70 family RNA polymerase sigma factor [Mogibacterium sp.]
MQTKEAVYIYEKDETVYRRFLSDRSESDLRILLERHRESLLLFLLGYVGNEEDAEELMMDTYAVVASGTSAFSGRSSFKTWLFGIARNQAKMFLRKKKGFFLSMEEMLEKSHYEQIADSYHDTPELELLRQEQNNELYMALETLPASYRQVLYLTYFEEMDADEAAHVMGKTKKQIYNLTERGRKALKEALERMGFDYAKY